MAYKHLGQNYLPPDVIAKVTGEAKYAEDFRADGMVYAKLVGSPMPHARVRGVDATEALKIPGVLAILRAADVPQLPPPQNPVLTDEPMYVGDPILAIAAVDELTAVEAAEALKLDLEPLPHVFDPLDTLFPGGPNARTNGNVANIQLNLQTVKWDAADFAVPEGKLPMGKPAEQWAYGDLEAGFRAAKVIVEESFVTASHAHHSMEPRSTFAYWQGDKCFVHGSTQSQTAVVPNLARLVNVPIENLVYVAEFCGGGFGSKGGAYPTMAIPAILSKKLGRPVMLRITRLEEYAIGIARPGFQGWVKAGFREDGRITALDLYVVAENGPNQGFPDFRNSGQASSIIFQPMAMRWRGISVLTNTPNRGAQRGPGENQTASALEPIIAKAARQLGIDQVQIRKINAPGHDGKIGGDQGPISSSYLREAIDEGAKLFNWEQKKRRSGQRVGNKLYGVGVGSAFHTAGNNGFDGLVRITPDGKLHIHSGVGNLGTFSYQATSMAAAEVLGVDWKNVILERGHTMRATPWSSAQVGSNTSYTMTRATYAGAMDAKAKLLEIAANMLGGKAEDYDLANERVVSKADASKSITFAQAATKAIELGGKYSGREVAQDLNPITKHAASLVAGTGLIGAGKDNLPRRGVIPGLSASYAEVEVDTETGKIKILSMATVTDCGVVIHPQSLASQLHSASVMGIGMAQFERYVYDPKIGIPYSAHLEHAKPPSLLDMPSGDFEVGWVNQPDNTNPLGVKGMGEPPMGSASAAILCAISDALGGRLFNRVPVTPDMVINALTRQAQSHKPLQVNTV